jgi:hypothetical protein
MSDTEGKAATVAAMERGKRQSFQMNPGNISNLPLLLHA